LSVRRDDSATTRDRIAGPATASWSIIMVVTLSVRPACAQTATAGLCSGKPLPDRIPELEGPCVVRQASCCTRFGTKTVGHELDPWIV